MLPSLYLDTVVRWHREGFRRNWGWKGQLLAYFVTLWHLS